MLGNPSEQVKVSLREAVHNTPKDRKASVKVLKFWSNVSLVNYGNLHP
jgi:hypothetical protein